MNSLNTLTSFYASAVNYLLNNNIVKIDDKFENTLGLSPPAFGGSILELASLNDDMYMTLFNSGLNVNVYMHRQVFLRNTIITKNSMFFEAYLDRANVHLLLCKLDQDIVSDDITFSRGDSIIDILVKINNSSMNEYIIKWLIKKVDEQNVSKAEKERNIKIIAISVGILVAVAVIVSVVVVAAPVVAANAKNITSALKTASDVAGNLPKFTTGENINWSANKTSPPKSKGERDALNVFQGLLPDTEIQTNIRPSWLKNTETNRNLGLNGFIPSRRIAYEFNGIQHTEYTSYFHKTFEEFESQQNRDSLKREMLKKLGIPLITIPHYYKSESAIENYIRQNHSDLLEL